MNVIKIIVIVVIVVLCIRLGYSMFATKGIEQISRTVLEKKDGYEIREYNEHIVAQVTISGGVDENVNEGFSLIADYIFGNNKKKSPIAMTTPVIQEGMSEKIAMTTPVIQEGTGATTLMAFVMPSKYTLETLPEPVNNRIRLIKIPKQKAAVIRFSGITSSQEIQNKMKTFENQLVKDGEKIVGATKLQRFDPPRVIPFLRTNEIVVPIE